MTVSHSSGGIRRDNSRIEHPHPASEIIRSNRNLYSLLQVLVLLASFWRLMQFNVLVRHFDGA